MIGQDEMISHMKKCGVKFEEPKILDNIKFVSFGLVKNPLKGMEFQPAFKEEEDE